MDFNTYWIIGFGVILITFMIYQSYKDTKQTDASDLKKSSKKSKKRQTYFLRSGKNGENVQELESVSSILKLNNKFYELSDWGQIKTLLETLKKAKNDTVFGTWIVNEFRFMEYSFKNEFKLKFAEQIMKYYRNDLSMKELKEYFDNNVIWKKTEASKKEEEKTNEKTETVKEFFDNGKLQKEYEINKKGQKNGFYKLYHNNGELRAETNYKDGVQNAGTVISFHNNGVKAREVLVKKGSILHGKFTEWDDNGNLKRKGNYEEGVMVSSENFNKQSYPAWFDGEKLEKGDTVKNPFTSELVKLNSIELSIHKLIRELQSDPRKTNFFMGGSAEFSEKVEKGIQWFEENNLEAYNILFKSKTPDDVNEKSKTFSKESIPKIEKKEQEEIEIKDSKKGYQHTTSDGKTYFLNTQDIELKDGRTQTIYYFSKDQRPEHCDMPDGKEVNFDENGLPYLAAQGTNTIESSVKYKYRLELNVTTYKNDEKLYRYDVYEAYFVNFPDGYGSFMKDNYDGDHISSADNGNIEDYAFYEGKFNWGDAEDELKDKYEGGYTENVDEFGAFETLKDVEKYVKKDADERFPDSGFEL